MNKKKVRDEKLLEEGEVSLVIEDYDEIFSDFDPRPFSHRALSVDFLDEARRATREIGEGKFELRFMLPSSKKNSEKEKLVRNRLKEHFKKHAGMLEKEHSKVIMQGIAFLFFGLIFMFSAAYIIFHYSESLSLMKEFVIVLLEPGGWFLFWEGLDLIIFEAKKKKPDLTFYRKMVKAEVEFIKY